MITAYGDKARFREADDRIDAQLADPHAVVVAGLDVAELPVRVGRPDPECDQRAIDTRGTGDHLDSRRGHRLAERVVLLDLVIGADDEHLLLVRATDGDGCKGQRRSGVAAHRLGQDACLRQLLPHTLAKATVRDRDDVHRVNEGRDQVTDPLQERPAIVVRSERDRVFVRSKGVLPRAAAPRQDHRVHRSVA